MKSTVACLFLALTAGAAAAESLTTSPKPRTKPAATLALAAASDPAVAMQRPRSRPSDLGSFVISGPAHGIGVPAMRPRLRSGGEPRSVQGADDMAPALPAAAGRAPERRPQASDDLARVTLVAFRAQPPAAIVSGLKGSVCGNPLLRGRTIPPIASRVRGCGLQDGVELTSVAGVRVGEGVQVDCTTALALADWVHDRLKPTVGNLGGGVVALETGPTYACRPRNNQKGNRVSEHGRGAAVDIMGIRLASGAKLSVRDDWGKAKEGRVLKAIHASACGPFTTVLGPKSDRFHKDHFHIDTAQGRGPYCR
jgi:hypothetical protein